MAGTSKIERKNIGLECVLDQHSVRMTLSAKLDELVSPDDPSGRILPTRGELLNS